MYSPIARLFPTPAYLRIATIGLDLSDSTLRLMELVQAPEGLLPKRIDEVSIPEGVLKAGRLADAELFTKFLREVKKKHRFIRYARISVPEPQVYSFTLELDISAGSNIRGAIELVLEDNIPLKVGETVFDYEVLHSTEHNIYVQVTAMADGSARALYTCFFNAGIIPVSFELEGQAIARAIFPMKMEGSCMVVDFGALRTGISIMTNGVVVYSSTIDFGGHMLSESLSKELNLTIEAAEKLKREFGLSSPQEQKKIFDVLASGLAVLKDEINRRFIYWHEKRQFPELLPNVSQIFLTGGHSNLSGLAGYLSSSLKIPVSLANPWQNCFSLDDYIPELDRSTAMSYTTAIGLALADFLYD